MAETSPNETGIKGTTTVVSDLMPGRAYRAQVAVAGQREREDGKPGIIRNPWSPALEFTTVEDNVAPAAPSDVTVEIDDGLYRIEWLPPTENEDGSPLSSTGDFRDYVVEVISDGELIQNFSVPYAGLEDDGTNRDVYILPVPASSLVPQEFTGDLTITFRVYSRDLGWNTSSNYSEAQTTIGIPDAPIGFSAESGQIGIKLRWYPPNDDEPEVSHYEIYSAPQDDESFRTGSRSGSMVSTFSAPLPPRSSTVVEGEERDYSQYTFEHVPGTSEEQWYKVIAVNSFGMVSPPSNTDSATAESPINDDAITAQPAAPTVSATEAEPHQFTLTHTLNSNDADSTPLYELVDNLAYLAVYAGPVGGPHKRLGLVAVLTNDGVYSDVEAEFTYVAPSKGFEIEALVAPVNSAGVENDDVLSPPSTPTQIYQVGPNSNYFEDMAIGNAYIQEVSASKLMADTAINKNLFIESMLTVAEGGLVKSDNYIPIDTTTGSKPAGWAIESSGYAELNNVRIRGAVEATSGFLDGLSVRNTITVGYIDDNETSDTGDDVYRSGAIRSITALSDGGWEINSDGDATFNNATIKGRIEADTGYLSGLTVDGNIIMNNTAAYIGTSFLSATSGGWRVYGDGKANFYDVTLRNLSAKDGYLENLNVRGTITVGEGAIAGKIRSSTYSTTSSGTGWEFNSNGTLTLRNGEIRLNNNLTINRDGIFSDSGDVAISAHTGRAQFTDGYFSGTIYAEDGTFGGKLEAADGSFVGTLFTDYEDNPSPGNKILIDQGDWMRVYGSNSPGNWTNNVYWRVHTTPQDNFLIEAAPDIWSYAEAYQGLAVRTRYDNYLQLHAFDAYSTPIYWSINVGRGTRSRSGDWTIGGGEGAISVANNTFYIGDNKNWSSSYANGTIYAGNVYISYLNASNQVRAGDFKTNGKYHVDTGSYNYISSGTQSGQISFTCDNSQSMLLGNGGIFLKSATGNTVSGSTSGIRTMYLANDGFVYRQSSSETTKDNIVVFGEENYSYSVLDLTPRFFDGNAFKMGEKIPMGRQVGLIAEEVHEKFPVAASLDENGDAVDVDFNQITTALLHEVQRLTKRVEDLELAQYTS